MAEIKKAEIKVAGMACAGCSGAVEKALSRLEGVTSAKVELAKKTAYVDYEQRKAWFAGSEKKPWKAQGTEQVSLYFFAHWPGMVQRRLFGSLQSHRPS